MAARRVVMDLLRIAAIAAMLTACGTLDHRAVPEDLSDQAELPGLSGIRYWGDAAPTDFYKLRASLEDKARSRHPDAADARERITLDHLALSGGGEYGAFGAGLLVGWSERGDRPEFQVVTGVSVGAIIAPFAFLGPRYDGQLRELITSFTNVASPQPGILDALFGVSVMDNAPLQRLIERFVTADMVAEIKAEYGKGRRLLIGTTNLHAARPVIWNIGRLAASGHPQTLPILRRIILASTAVPGAFAPVSFEVVANGKHYDELHVDGAVTTVVFFYPAQLHAAELIAKLPFRQRLYVIRNRKLAPDYAETITGLADVSARAIDTVIRAQGNGDLSQVYLIAKRDGIDYNLAYIPSSFDLKSTGLFDYAYMQALFDTGYRLGKEGYRWSKSPPGVGE
jgi:predicted acylesterase/phospholipase RssA